MSSSRAFERSEVFSGFLPLHPLTSLGLRLKLRLSYRLSWWLLLLGVFSPFLAVFCLFRRWTGELSFLSKWPPEVLLARRKM